LADTPHPSILETARVPIVRERDAPRARVRELETDHGRHAVTGLHGTLIGWEFCAISDAGEPAPISLAAIFERGRFSQVLMQRGTPGWTMSNRWRPC
jgi:hypothetical protein